MTDELIILSPGPSNVSPRVRAAMTRPLVGHRDEDFAVLQRSIRTALLRVLAAPPGYEAVLFGGSATVAIESLLTAAGTLGTTVVLANGVYGERAATILGTYGLPFRLLRHEWGAPLDLQAVQATLSDPGVASLYVVHHETTTGVLNPLPEIAALARDARRRLLVDGTSSLGGEALDLGGWGIAGLVGSANKCLRGAPGLSFVVVRRDLIDAARHRARRVSYATDLLTHLDAEAHGAFPFTPPVQAAFALHEALTELEEEGLARRHAHYRRVARVLRAGLRDLGLTLYIDPERLASTMTPVRFPPGMTYADLHAPLKDRGFLIYEAQGHLRAVMYRLGTVGHFGEVEIVAFLERLDEVLSRVGASR